MAEVDIRGYFKRDNVLVVGALCFLWSCFRLDAYPNAFLSQAGHLFSLADASLFDNVYTVGLLVGFLAVLALGFKRGSGLLSRWTVGAIGIVGIAGIALIAASAQEGGVSVALAAVGLAASALFVAFATAACGAATVQAPCGVAAVNATVSYVLYVVLLSCFGAMEFEMSFLAPFVITGCLLARSANHPVAPCTMRSVTELPWIMTLCSALLIYVGTWVLGEALVGFTPNASDLIQLLLRVMFVSAGALILLPLGAGSYSQRKLVVAFAGLIILYCAIALLAVLFPSFVNGLPANKALFRMFLWVALAYTVAGRGLSPYPAFSVYGIIVVCFSHPLTSGLIHGQGFLHGLLQSPVALPVIAVVLFAAVTVAVVLLARWYLAPRPEGAKPASGCPQAEGACEACAVCREGCAEPVDPLALARERVIRATEKRGLTTREEEVAVLAYRGFSAKGIGEELYLSESTVRGYMGHVYRKMGVHRKQELIDLIDQLNEK